MKIHELTEAKKTPSANLREGIHDPNIFKAIFTIGGPGSGKTTLANKLLGATGLRPVNVDAFYEMLMKQQPISGGYQKELYKHAGNKMQKRMDHLTQGRIGLVIDGTGRNTKRVEEIRQYLVNLGYHTMALFVDTDLDTALERNQTRQRKVDPEKVKKMHSEVRQNLGKLKEIFNNQLVVVDNTSVPELKETVKIIDKFLDAPVNNSKAREWVNQQSKKS